jgi:lactoylglutathione lyase
MKLDHVGIKVKDMDKALEFYTQVLGFRILEKLKLLGNDYFFVGNEHTRIEIELAPKGSHLPDINLSTGLYHIALLVDDLEGEAARLKEHDVKFVLQPVQLRPDRKIAFIEDPDGTRIQLIQMLS